MKRFSKITTTQLARICGVSQGTVDRALHDRKGIKKQTRDHVLAVAREYDYAPAIQNTSQENSMLIGVVLFDLYNEFFSKLAMSLVNAAKKSGHSIVFQFSEKDAKSERAALEYFDYIGVDGIVLFSVGSDREDYHNYLRSLKKPLVLIGNPMASLPYVGIDDEAAMEELSLRFAESLSSKEVRYYAPVLEEELHQSNAQRLRQRGFIKAMNALNKSYRTVTDLKELSCDVPTVCSTDYYAWKALCHWGSPKDARIAGFDNVSLFQGLPVKVMTVDYSTDSIARECMNYLLGRKTSPRIPHRVLFHGEERKE